MNLLNLLLLQGMKPRPVPGAGAELLLPVPRFNTRGLAAVWPSGKV